MNRKLILLVGLIAGVGSLGACADRGSREAFRRDLQARLEQLDLKIGQLEDRTRQAKEDARPQNGRRHQGTAREETARS